MTYLDSVVGLAIIMAFFLYIWSKFTQQSMKQILGEIRDMLADAKDDEVLNIKK